MDSAFIPNRKPLPEAAFSFLPLGTIKPRGWLQRQLQIQADGLTGHLEEIWHDLGSSSGWLGGEGESWERGPYYLDGLIPLAYTLGDESLINKAQKWMDWVLDNQAPNGWLGPVVNEDWWPLAPMLKALTQYQEATADPRVIPAMERFFSLMRVTLPDKPLKDWAVFRWADMAVSVIWLYNRTGDAELLINLKLLMEQGFDWSANFADFSYTEKTAHAHTHPTHVVNNAMAVKTPAIAWLISNDEKHRQVALSVMDILDRYHGQVSGLFSGDELLAGKSPSQGTELCAVVEYMFSLEISAALYRQARFGDRLEMLAFNGLPGAFSGDMWSHQYDQQANQVLCNIAKHPWTNNQDDANIFGLQPNYGCCTANMHQGWPKFASHLWMAAPDGGLAAVAYAPCEVTTRIKGKQVRVIIETDYPAGESIHIRVQPEEPLFIPLYLRIPEWAKGVTLEISEIGKLNAPEDDFVSIGRTWFPGDRVKLKLPMPVRTVRGYNNSVSLLRGPLVFSLKIGEDWRKVRGEDSHPDYEVYPTTPWNYGLALDPADPGSSVKVRLNGMGDCPFSPDGAPVEIRARGRRIPEWGLELNSAAPPPESPVNSEEPLEELTLIPYGSAKLRITEFPLLESK